MPLLVHMIQDGLCFFHTFIPSWGLSIIVFTSAVRVFLFPLQVYGVKEQRRLQKLKPEIEALKKQFKDEPLRLFTEQQRLMKNLNVRPVWILISSLVQLPIFYSMYNGIRLNKSLSVASFAWFSSLGAPDPFLVLPVFIALLMWYQMRSSTPSARGVLKYVMPALSFAFMVSLPAAVVLYSLTGGLLQFLGAKLIDCYY
jgi:YidC/Oxa1 family membrane protein insertase